MAARMEVPNLEDLLDVQVEVEQAEEPWVVAVTARAEDGDVVTVAWDEIGGSVRIRWLAGDTERLVLEREGSRG